MPPSECLEPILACIIGICYNIAPVGPQRYMLWHAALKTALTQKSSNFHMVVTMSASAKSVECDCDTSVPGREIRCFLCRECL